MRSKYNSISFACTWGTQQYQVHSCNICAIGPLSRVSAYTECSANGYRTSIHLDFLLDAIKAPNSIVCSSMCSARRQSDCAMLSSYWKLSEAPRPTKTLSIADFGHIFFFSSCRHQERKVHGMTTGVAAWDTVWIFPVVNRCK